MIGVDINLLLGVSMEGSNNYMGYHNLVPGRAGGLGLGVGVSRGVGREE